ncbi:MAG: NAD(P)-dependent oxidoreductase [Eubacteriales bacterium]|nr:NAD(P)-dependent oxidoreductase [Clostridiales bacterium]MDY6072611.1 NAD(P)-dependent oxidoreductase [Eubacteriales bacterium]
MVLIIGATSFLAVHTVDALLENGEKVAVTGRDNKFKDYFESKGVEYYTLDLAKPDDFNNLPTGDVKGVILLAALLPANSTANLVDEENAADYFVINTLGTVYTLEYCRKNDIKRLISTVSYTDVAASLGKGYVITEEEPRNYFYHGDHAVYAFSKNAASDLMEYYNQQHNMKNIWFRLPTVYGVGPHGSLRVNGELKKSGIQIFMEKASQGEDITIFGDKNLSRDVAYVKDVAKAFCQAMDSENAKGLYNMTCGSPVTLDEQAKVIVDVFSKSDEKKSKILYNPKLKNDGPSYEFSIEKAKKDFGYNPEYKTFKSMMIDFKKDMDEEKYLDLFNYPKL